MHQYAADLGVPDMSGQKTVVDGKHLSWDEWLTLRGAPGCGIAGATSIRAHPA